MLGTTTDRVAGVPAGALPGQPGGWLSAVWSVALVSVPAIVAIMRSVPAGNPGSAPSTRGELRSLRDPRLVVTLSPGALARGADRRRVSRIPGKGSDPARLLEEPEQNAPEQCILAIWAVTACGRAR